MAIIEICVSSCKVVILLDFKLIYLIQNYLPFRFHLRSIIVKEFECFGLNGKFTSLKCHVGKVDFVRVKK